MFRTEKFELKSTITFRKKCVEWLRGFDTFCILDSNAHLLNSHNFDFRDYDIAIAVDVIEEISSEKLNSLSDIDTVFERNPNWYFGFFSYDLKNETEDLKSENVDNLDWPTFCFFLPKYLILVKNKQVIIQSPLANSKSGADIFTEIKNTPLKKRLEPTRTIVKPRMSRNEYIESIKQIKKHIIRGDIYEVNFCQEFYALSEIDPFNSYLQLNAISPTPFSCFFRLHDKYLISASPERFIKRRDLKLISQPIKGTIKRGFTIEEDNELKSQLRNDPKERAENIMIVDLVRNDLSKIAARRTVHVDELCGIYSFSNVHQMISTISAITTTGSIEKIIKATFPMGSMTGAPKIKAMEIAEKYETTKRGLYSGSVGYITPNKDFDFNVVIRSLQYNKNNKYLSYMVGGAITASSDEEKEYEECILKASAIEKLLQG